MPREHSFIGMSEKVWKNENSLKPEDMASFEKDYEEVGVETADGEGEEEEA